MDYTVEKIESEIKYLSEENAELKDYVRSIFGQGLKFMKEVMQ